MTEPIDRNRLAQVRPRISRRWWLAILATLGVGGGTVVVVDQARDRPRVDPPPVVVDPPPRGDNPTRPPPSVEWPALTSMQSSTWGGFNLSAETTGVAFKASGPPDGQMGAMVALASYGKIHKDYRITDCLFATTPPYTMQWGIRAYDVIDWTIRRTRFQGPAQEHGAYLNAPGSLLIEDCEFTGWGGAGIQVTFRKKEGAYAVESVDPLLAAQPSTHVYRRVSIHSCGDPESDRFGAYLLSEHAPEIDWNGYVSYRIEADIVVDACTIRGGNLSMDYKGQQIRSTRGLLVQQRPSLTVTGSVIDVPDPMDGWNSQIWAVDRVVLKDSEFNGGTIEIRWAKSVTIENCTGDARVIVGGGSWNVWPMTGKIHDAPISTNWTWNE